jgi:hypothetical protein
MPKLEISKVHDAYAEHGECPLCSLMDSAEKTCLVSFQGSRVMEPNVRVQTNKMGFCPDHYRKLYRGENKLGLSLVVHTHLQEKLPRLAAALEGAVKEAEAALSRKSKDAGARPLDPILRFLDEMRESCFICGLLAVDLDRYLFTIVYLWKQDPGFREVLRASRGFCLVHVRRLFEYARDALKARELAGFLEDVVPLMTGSLARLEREIFGFTQLFHDSNRSLGSDAERTALARTLQKLSGSTMKPE